MIVIKEKRNQGKTEKLVALLEKDISQILLVFSLGEAHRIIAKYDSKTFLDLSWRVMTWDYYRATPELWGRPLLIDNVDMFLQYILKSAFINGVSINED